MAVTNRRIQSQALIYCNRMKVMINIMQVVLRDVKVNDMLANLKSLYNAPALLCYDV